VPPEKRKGEEVGPGVAETGEAVGGSGLTHGEERRAGGGEQAGGGGSLGARVEHEAKGLGGQQLFAAAGGEARVIGQDSAETDQHGVGAGTHLMHAFAGGGAGDPLGSAGASGDAGVEGEGLFEGEEGEAGSLVLEVGTVEAAGLVGKYAGRDGDAGGLENTVRAAGSAGVAVSTSIDNPGYSRVQEGGSTGRSAAVVGAGLEGDVDGGAAGGGSGGTEGFDLGVGLSGGVVVALADDLTVAHNYGTDGGVGGSVAQAEGGKLEGTAHVVLVGRRHGQLLSGPEGGGSWVSRSGGGVPVWASCCACSWAISR
jgi:hypothetical protein